MGFLHPADFIGKTVFDIHDDQESAILIGQTDREIMETGKPVIVEKRLIPERLAFKVPIQIIPLKTDQQNQHDASQPRKVDIILLDDSQVFADSIIFRLTHRNVVHYTDPRIFLAESEGYAKDTPVCIDNHFGIEIPFDGMEVAQQLHARGFTRLFILSGAHFEKHSLPDYVTLIIKMDLDLLDSL